jgi:hypothetical protein
LKLLSDGFSLAVVVVNQVSDLFINTPVMGANVVPSQRETIPALGLTWSNCVNTRLMLSRTRRNIPVPPLLPIQQPDIQAQKKRKSNDANEVRIVHTKANTYS